MTAPRFRRSVRIGALGAAAALVLTGATQANAADPGYTRTDLVADQSGGATIKVVDPSLVNAWGMSQSATSPVWVSNAETHVSTLYSGATATTATKASLTVVVPGGAPTGQVFSAGNEFVVCSGACGPSRFIFATERGVISGWNPAVNLTGPAPSTHAVAAVAVPGASYKGLALAQKAGVSYLYAANFRAGTVDVFDSTFVKQTWAGAFVDPNLPARYAPFNVASLRGLLYVSYAVQDRSRTDDVAGPGNGIVDVFNTDGTMVRRLITGKGLNAPWGMVHASGASGAFGKFSGSLLVGNFGDGRIHAYDPRNGSYRGVVSDSAGNPIEIDGLWGLLFGNGVSAAPNALMYTAGPGDEEHGLFGIITAN
jgi:uncharacterized protein (TIGR03118 family)